MDLGLQRQRIEMGLSVFSGYCQNEQLYVRNK